MRLTVLFHPAANTGVEHPLRNLQSGRSVHFAFHATHYHTASASRFDSNVNLLSVPQVPAVTHFAITGFMGVLYPTCITKIGLIWAWTSRLPQAAKRARVTAQQAATLSAYQGSVAYTPATTSPPDLATGIISVRNRGCRIVSAVELLCVLLRSIQYPRSPTCSYPIGMLSLTPNISSMSVPLTVNCRCNLGRIERWRQTARQQPSIRLSGIDLFT